jgi:hypothetical protein
VTQHEPVPETAVALIDAIEDQDGLPATIVPADARVTVRGWLLDAGGRPFEQAEVEIEVARAAGAPNEQRPDVGERFGVTSLVGFRVELALGAVAYGRHPVRVIGVRPGGERVAIPTAAVLDVVAPTRALPAGTAPGELLGYVDDVEAEEGSTRHRDEAGRRVVYADGAVVVTGWAATPAHEPVALAYAEADGSAIFRGMTGYPRPDVAAALGAPPGGFGFRVRIPASALGLGEHAVRALGVAGGRVGQIGAPVALVVAERPGHVVFERRERGMGRVDLVGRLDEERVVREQRSYLRMLPGDRAVLSGWAGDPESAVLPDRLVLVVDGFAHGAVQRGIERPDVVASTGCAALRRSGFSAVLRCDALSTGFHRAEIVASYGGQPVIVDALSFDIVTP